MPVWLILLTTVLYMGVLFVVAWRADSRERHGQKAPHPIIYALALAVYCTSWTYFGAVGSAAANGWEYLTIYIGPALVFFALPGMVARIGDVAKRESISSLSDFLSARYGKSRAVAAVATLAAVAGSLPYISLQLKSVGMSFQTLAYGAQTAGIRPANETVLLTGVALAVFAILFGTRQSDTTRHNRGLMFVLAIEAVLKLCALLAITVLSLILLNRPDVIVPSTASEPFGESGFSGRFITMTMLSMAAIICLPRQFHVAVIERRSTNEINWARWLFPVYMLLTCLVVFPITIAGLSILPGSTPADLFVLDLPLSQGNNVLALLVFLGGFSAAIGMVMVSTIALSTMVTNDLIVPLIMHFGRFSSLSGNAGSRLVIVRRAVIAGLLALAYWYYRVAGSTEALAQIGLLSFAAAIQFAPALIGAVYWRGGRRTGVLVGLITGVLVWVYTLFLPAIFTAEKMATWVPEWLAPHALFTVSFDDSLTHGVVWSLGLNILTFVLVSLRSRERLRDRVQAAVFVGDDQVGHPEGDVRRGEYETRVTSNGLKTLASRFLTPEAVDSAFEDFTRQTGVQANGDVIADWRLVQRTERLLASALGTSSARVVLASAIGGGNVALPDVLSMLDHKTQAERFERHMLQSMLENISQGISMVDANQNLVAWNTAYVELFNYPEELIGVGVPITKLIEHNIQSGWIDGDPVEQAERRVEFMKTGRPHSYERQNPDGRYLRISGSPMPGGGYVSTFTDITQDRLRQQALVEANETLEARVDERTEALQKMAVDLDYARREAEGANASKTRFLAAASHDLLQPLNAARLFLGSMEAGGATVDLVSKVDKSIQSADELLRGLLDISRLDHGHIEARPVKLPVGPLLEDLVDEAEPMAKQAGLDIRLAPTQLAVMADPDFLSSILRNFLSNARRYTQQGGILIGARPKGDFVRIEVWDTGPGISVGKRDEIFEEFRRFEDEDNVGIRGAGLGLSVAKRLARLMGAEINVKSEVGKGSVFSILLPRAGAQPKSYIRKTLRQLEASSDLNGLNVLFVDDEATILEGMARLLESWGCNGVAASSASDAIELLKSSRFDALIADLKLRDDVSGLDIISSHRSNLSCAQNTLLLTATATETVRSKASEMGVSVLRKPSSPGDIKKFLIDCKERVRD